MALVIDRDGIDRLFAEGKIDVEQWQSWIAFLDLCERSAAEQFDQLVASLAAVEPQGEWPAPGECHPAYTDRRDWIVDWLDHPDTHPAGWTSLMLPIRERFAFTADTFPTSTMRSERLDRHLCWGLAPFVGEPFHYEWWVAVDEHRRWIAGDARLIRHTPA